MSLKPEKCEAKCNIFEEEIAYLLIEEKKYRLVRYCKSSLCYLTVQNNMFKNSIDKISNFATSECRITRLRFIKKKV